MIKAEEKELPWWKSLFIHGDFANIPDEFNIYEGNEPSRYPAFERKGPFLSPIKIRIPQPNTHGNSGEITGIGEGITAGGIKIPPNIEMEVPEFDDLLWGNEYNGDILQLMSNTIWSIRELEARYDSYYAQLENELNKLEY